MPTFDPAAATATYLAQISPAAHARATAYTHGQHWLLLGGWAVTLLACWLILKSGVLARVEGRLEARRSRPLLVSLAIGVLFLALDWLLELPWSSYADWWREASYGLSNQSWLGWLAENAVTSAITIPVTGLFLVGVYWLMRRAPIAWPLLAGVLTAVFMLLASWAQPLVIEPLVNSYVQAPPGPVREAVTALGRANGVPTDKIYVFNGSKQSDRYTANVAGLFGTARVALSDTMFRKGADIAEIRAVVGHEMGHYVHMHVLLFAAASGVMAVLGGWLVQGLFPMLRHRLRAAEVGGVSDPAGLPILVAIFVTLVLVATPIENALTRMGESDADAFSLARAREPDGLARALVKTIDYRASSPGDLEEFLFYDNPSVQRRIRRAMDWKAAHSAKP